MSRSRRALFVKHLLWPVLAAAVCCLIWVVVLGRAEQERSRAGTQAAHDAASLAAAYEQYLTRSVAQMDQTTMQLKHSWEHGNPPRLLESLKQDGMFTDPGFVAVLLLAPDGSVRSSIRERRLDGAAALADTAFFKDHKNNISTALRIGVAPASLGYPDETILFTRRLDTSADEFDGVVVLAVQARYFTDFLGPATLGPQGLVAVSANDGAVQVATRDSKAAARRLPANAGLWSADEGVRLLPGQGADAFGDGVARTLAWRRSSAYPLVALVGLAQSDSLAGAAQSWRDARLATTLATVVLLAIGMLASVLAIRADRA